MGGIGSFARAFELAGDLDLVKMFEEIVIKELKEPNTNGRYVKRYQVPWAEWESEAVMPINLDGEPIKTKKVRFEVVPGAIKLVVPAACPLTTSLL